MRLHREFSVQPHLSLCLCGKFLLLLFLFGCQSTNSWEVAHIQTGRENYNSARLVYPVRDIVNGIAVGMVCAQGQVNTYLEVHTQTIPPYQGNPKEALVVMKIAEQMTQRVACRHEGGQRLSLPSDLSTLMIESLQQNHPVTIILEGYATTIHPEDFSKRYQQLHAAPLTNRFQLPFKL